MKTIFIICIIIVIIVLLLSVLTTSKAYQFKHTVDPIKKPAELETNDNEVEKEKLYSKSMEKKHSYFPCFFF